MELTIEGRTSRVSRAEIRDVARQMSREYSQRAADLEDAGREHDANEQWTGAAALDRLIELIDQ